MQKLDYQLINRFLLLKNQFLLLETRFCKENLVLRAKTSFSNKKWFLVVTTLWLQNQFSIQNRFFEPKLVFRAKTSFRKQKLVYRATTSFYEQKLVFARNYIMV